MADYEKIGKECHAIHTATPVDPQTDAALHFARLMYPGAYRPAASPGGGGRVATDAAYFKACAEAGQRAADALREVSAILGAAEGESPADAARRVVDRLRTLELTCVARREIGAWQREVTDGVPVLPGPAPEEDAFITIDTDGCVEYAATEAEAFKSAEDILKRYRDEALEIGEWLDDVEGVLVARVIARAVEVSREPSEDPEVDAVDYGMRRVGELEIPADELDPVAAVERVTGGRWVDEGYGWEIDVVDGPVLAVYFDGGWYLLNDLGLEIEDHEDGDRASAALFCLRAIHAGTVTLPDSCPGLAALTPAEREAFLGVSHV